MIRILLVLVCCYYGSIEAHDAILPEDWQVIAGNGFTTLWFKSLNGYITKYRTENIQDIYNKGFRNLRIRCRTGIPGYNITKFLPRLNKVVDDCLKVGVVPIVSWVNHKAEAYATDTDYKGYIDWWTQVASLLKGKDYRLAYNLFTELGKERECGPQCEALNKEAEGKKYSKHFVCPTVCGASLRENQDKYNKWTRNVVKKIRAIDRNRILILGSPRKTGDALKDIPRDIYEGDKYIMAEWHVYASGPDKVIITTSKGKKIKNFKYWVGTGDQQKRAGKNRVDQALSYATEWTEKTGVRTYLGEWMPQDSLYGKITQREANAFAKYFVTKMREIGVPWSLNQLTIYYDTKNLKWYRGRREITGHHRNQTLNWSKLLTTIIQTMKKPSTKDQFYQPSVHDETYDEKSNGVDDYQPSFYDDTNDEKSNGVDDYQASFYDDTNDEKSNGVDYQASFYDETYDEKSNGVDDIDAGELYQ